MEEGAGREARASEKVDWRRMAGGSGGEAAEGGPGGEAAEGSRLASRRIADAEARGAGPPGAEEEPPGGPAAEGEAERSPPEALEERCADCMAGGARLARRPVSA